jgi:translation initiation factor 1
MAPTDNRRLVYSSDGGPVRYCRRCGQLEHPGRCQSPAPLRHTQAPDDGIVRIARDRKGRGGKTVTLITGLPGDTDALAALAQTLKRACGSGGTVKGRAVEIQGDHRERLAALLTSQGYHVKLAGG